MKPSMLFDEASEVPVTRARFAQLVHPTADLWLMIGDVRVMAAESERK
jgi:hypothetical protein